MNPMPPCLSCQKSSSSPVNFLLNCISCANSWHHRCHSPPVSDKELILIIKTFNAEKHDNAAAKLIWQCGICIKAKNSVNQQKNQVTTQLIAVKKVTSRHVATHVTTPSRLPQKAIVIDDEDDDEIIVLDGPPEVPKHDETTNLGVSYSSHAVNPQRSSTIQDSLSHLKHQSSTVTSFDQLNIPHVQPPPERTSCTKVEKIRIIDDPFLVPDLSHRASKLSQTSSSSKPQVLSGFFDLAISSDEEMKSGGDDDALEHLIPPPTPAPTSKQVVGIVEEVPLILTSNQAPPHPLPRDARPTIHTLTMTTSPQPPNQLLIQWLNDRNTTSGVKPDLWARACLRRDQDAANKKNEQSAQPASCMSPSSRKCKAHKLNEGSHTYSRATFFLSAKGWLREKQASLL